LTQHTMESLLELQLEVVTSALTNAAEQLERVSRARGVRELVGGQAAELKAARERIMQDIKRVVAILKRAGKGARSVATYTLADVRRPPGEATEPARRATVRKVKRTPGKAKRKVAKTVRRARRSRT